MRAHSVVAEGGTAAVIQSEEGDSPELHAWDTVKGSDFLTDQDVVDVFVRTIPSERSYRSDVLKAPAPSVTQKTDAS